MKILVSFIFSLLIVSCTTQLVELRIDNPTEQAISIDVDEQTYFVGKDSILNITIKAGEHEFLYEDNSFFIQLKPSASGSIINPTGANYYLAYFTDSNNDMDQDNRKIYEGLIDTVEIYSTEIIGPFKETSDFFINKELYNWDYTIDEDGLKLAKEIKANLTTLKLKIFREIDFWESIDLLYIESINTNGRFD